MKTCLIYNVYILGALAHATIILAGWSIAFVFILTLCHAVSLAVLEWWAGALVGSFVFAYGYFDPWAMKRKLRAESAFDEAFIDPREHVEPERADGSRVVFRLSGVK